MKPKKLPIRVLALVVVALPISKVSPTTLMPLLLRYQAISRFITVLSPAFPRTPCQVVTVEIVQPELRLISPLRSLILFWLGVVTSDRRWIGEPETVLSTLMVPPITLCL